MVPGRDGTVACVWTPDDSVLDGAGLVRPEIVWAVLDCPSGWTADLVATPMVVGWMRAEVLERPEGGRECVVVARLDSVGDRALAATSALYGGDGALLAKATTRWYPPG